MKVSEALGEIVWLMSQSAFHKQIFISDLEGMVMPPVLLGQFRLFHQPVEQPTSMPGAAATPGGTAQRPIGVVLWAQVNAEVEARLAAGGVRMRPQDWRSGDKLWVGRGDRAVRWPRCHGARLEGQGVPDPAHQLREARVGRDERGGGVVIGTFLKHRRGGKGAWTEETDSALLSSIAGRSVWSVSFLWLGELLRQRDRQQLQLSLPSRSRRVFGRVLLPETAALGNSCDFGKASSDYRVAKIGIRLALCWTALAGLEGQFFMPNALGQTTGADAEPRDEQLDVTIGKQKLRLPSSLFNFKATQIENMKRNGFPSNLVLSFSLCWPDLHILPVTLGRPSDCDPQKTIHIRDVRFGDEKDPHKSVETKVLKALIDGGRSKTLIKFLQPDEQEAAKNFYKATGVELLEKRVMIIGRTPDAQLVSSLVRVTMYPAPGKVPQTGVIFDVEKERLSINFDGWVESKAKTYNYLFLTSGASIVFDWPRVFDHVDRMISDWISSAAEVVPLQPK